MCATITTMVIFYALTGKVVLAMGAGAIEVVVKLSLYYFHERVWGWLGIGRKEHPLSSLPVRKALDEEDMETIKNKLKELGYIGED